MKRFFLLMIIIIILLGAFCTINILINEKHRNQFGDYPNENEFLKTIDCAPIFDSNPGGIRYKISFDIKTNVPGFVKVYMQNGETYRYSWDPVLVVDTTEEYTHYDLEVEPVLVNKNEKYSFLSFYSQYGSGIIPIVKNLVVEPIY